MLPVQSNLSVTFTYKDLLFRKLYHAILCSVFSQILILHVCLIIVNGDPFNPLSWIRTSFDTVTSFTAWLYVIPHMAIIFAQCLICAKDYVLRPSFSFNRFYKFVSVFSLHNFVLVLLHSLVGIVQVWLVLSLVGGEFKKVTRLNDKKVTCLVEETLFLELGGLWIGLYYFIKVYISDKHLSFPIIQQQKLTHFKSSLLPLLKTYF
ncbi:nucleoporin NDC1-like [Coccinella septempunctata]|uniref:nucleoporin NDC1-like n=1 Tax=Coccinella septempunctata TaxID=41139 RepID=UPI001D07C0DA|nr:nucleoporin NDC1-like [Coccinella septempunctata]